MNQEKPIMSYCCVLDASTYVGFWILKKLLARGYSVRAAIRKNGKILHFVQSIFDLIWEYRSWQRALFLLPLSISWFSLMRTLVLGESMLEKNIRNMQATEERLVVYDVDVLDYQSILVSLNNCNVVFCCLDNPEGYDVSFVLLLSLEHFF